jgi:predicted nucleic acid-binding protein
VALTVLDASIVIAVLDPADAHHAVAAEALRTCLAARDRFVLPASAYAEVLVGPYRRGPEAVATLNAFLDALPCDLEPVGRATAGRAARLRADHGPTLRLPDALVLATALEIDAARVLTTDRGWPPVAGVSIEVI